MERLVNQLFMNIRRLEYFLVVGQTGNLKRAGEILHVSAPALSKAMKVLEEELDVNLWVRDGRRITLSQAGQRLLKRAPALIDELRKLGDSLRAEPAGCKPIRIGTFEVFSTYFLTFLDRLGWNDHSLELHELLPGEIEKYLLEGDLDLGITYLPVPEPELDFLKVAAIEMGVFTKKGAFSGVSQPEIPFVVPVMPLQGTPTRVRGLDGWPEDAYRRKVLHQVTLLESALELCRQGRVAGYFPVFVVNEHNHRMKSEYKLERRKSIYPGRICRADVFVVKRKSDEETLIAKQLAKAVRLICG